MIYDVPRQHYTCIIRACKLDAGVGVDVETDRVLLSSVHLMSGTLHMARQEDRRALGM